MHTSLNERPKKDTDYEEIVVNPFKEAGTSVVWICNNGSDKDRIRDLPSGVTILSELKILAEERFLLDILL